MEQYKPITGETPISNIKSILRLNEEIIYTCRPNKKGYFFSQLVKMSPFVIIWLCFDLFAIFASFTSMGVDIMSLFFLLLFFSIHLMPVWIWLYGFVKDISACKHTEYAITNQRVIIKSGQKMADVISIDYKKISALNVRIGFIDKMLKVGDLYITAQEQIAVIYDIEQPKALMKKIYEIAKEEKMRLQTNSKPETSPLSNKYNY